MQNGPCPDCGLVEREEPGAIEMPGTPHRADCPRVALPPRTPEEDEEFRRELAAIEEAERQAWIGSRDVWIR